MYDKSNLWVQLYCFVDFIISIYIAPALDQTSKCSTVLPTDGLYHFVRFTINGHDQRIYIYVFRSQMTNAELDAKIEMPQNRLLMKKNKTSYNLIPNSHSQILNTDGTSAKLALRQCLFFVCSYFSFSNFICLCLSNQS